MKSYNFFIDIDDTLIPRGLGLVPEENLLAIKEAKAAGHKIFVNTGRPLCDIPREFFDTDYFDGVCSGGDYVQYEGNAIYSSFLSTEDAKSLFKALMSMDKRIDFNIGGLKNRYYIGDKQPHYTDTVYRPINSAHELDTVFDGDSLQKYFLCQSGEPDSEVRRELERYFSIITHPTYTEGFLHGHDKAFLIKKTENALSLPHENTVAIGDSLNDIEMLRYAPTSYAMGNAPDEVKRICTSTTCDCDKNGVAYVLAQYI